jgi:enediyne biosynthesis protein E4
MPASLIRTPCGALVVFLVAAAVLRGDGGITSQPLAPHPFAQGKTMFTLLPPEATGVRTENRFNDPRMRAELYQEFETSSIGTGVAIGDYDGDGRPDIFVVSKTEGCRLFRNLGNYRFEDVTAKAGVGAEPGVWNSGATFVDLNNSGRLDIYVCRTNAPNLLYVNQGDGTFKEEAHAYGLDVVDSSVMAAFCDYDRDGALDLYLATNILNAQTHPNGQRGYLFHNNRNGTFTNVTETAGITGETQSHSATWWDYDNDGWPDLYVANDYGAPDRLYHNNRDGTFTDVLSQVAPRTSFSSMGADLGDVNNTGLIDFIVADMAATNHQKDQHSLADARGRTEEDLVSPTPKTHWNALLLNTGTGRFMEGAHLEGVAATDWTWCPLLEDLDNDGRLDLFITNGFPRDPGVDVIRRSMAAESPAERIRIMYDSPMQAERHLGLRNLGDYQFEDDSTAWGLDQKGVSFGAAVGDLSGDGNLDIVYSNYHAGVTILRNDCATGHVVNFDLRGTVSNHYGVGATVRVESGAGVQTQQLVLARGYMSSSEPMLHFGFGTETVIRRVVVTWPSGHVQEFENLAVDRRYTVTEPPGAIAIPPAPAVPKPLFQEVGRAEGFALASRQEPVDETYLQRLIPVRLNPRGPALAVGDIFGTGAADVVIGGTSFDPLRVLRGTPSAPFQAADGASVVAASPVDDGPLLLFDAAGTGGADLLVTKGGNSLEAGSPEYQPRLFLNDGHGGFHAAAADALPALPISAGAAAAADFDHSGRLGLFIGGRVLPGQYPAAPPSALLANRGGKFEDVTDSLAPGLRTVGLVTSALWTDVDGDGWADLLVATEWGPVRYFHNLQGKGFADWTEKAGFASGGTGWWTSIAAADFNGDGRIDYVVGNEGLNSPYHGDAAHPALLYAGDFKGGGSSQLIEAYYEGDKIYPWRSRQNLGAVFPFLLRKYPTAEAFGHATVEDVFGAAKVAQATRYAATELRSGVFLSQPDGTYRFEALPRIAQISILQGMVAGDFEGTGHADLYAVQNSYAPVASVGRQDGGLSQLLRGDGHGHFTAVPVAESGLLVPENAKALAAVDLDNNGWAGFLVTRNNGTTAAFRNGGRAGHHPLRIALKGAAGNPTAVGARITVELADGTAETAEVYAGSGYYSQSSASCFFGYPDGNAPRRILVRWPSGQQTEHPYPAGAAILTLAAP